jgi:hypothetical protein
VRGEESDPLGPIVREALGQSRTDCPNVELLAAYADRTLDASAELELQRHLASCARCRETVLLMTRAADAEEAGGTRVQPRSTLQPYLKWLGGAAAAGLAVALWALVAPREDLTRFNKAEERKAQVAAEAPPERAVPPPVPNGLPESAQRRPVAKDTPGERERRERDDRAKLAENPAVPPEPPAAAAPPAAAEEAKADASLDRAQARRREALQDFRAGAAEGSLAADAPGGGVRWRIGAAGSVQRSSDGGAFWNEEPVKAPGARAMAAPAPDVCWIVGDDGLVLRYHAGAWQRLKPPADAVLVAITAVDALRATVTLADGRRLTTEDGGASWK